jgi:hypothetical protein
MADLAGRAARIEVGAEAPRPSPVRILRRHHVAKLELMGSVELRAICSCVQAVVNMARRLSQNPGISSCSVLALAARAP